MALLLLGRAEQLVPDVHDGDAPAAALSAGGVLDERGATAAAQAPSNYDGLGAHTAAVPSTHQEHGPPSSGTPHSLHLDHCSHSHVVAPTASGASCLITERIAEQTLLRPEAAPSVVLAPRLRPPIA